MIVARYLARETLSTFAAVLAVLLLIFSSQQFIRFLGNALNGTIGSDMVLSMLGLQMIIMLNLLLPLAFFVGALLGIGRMYVDSEISVLRACGFSEWQFLRWLGVPAVLVMVVSAGIAYVGAPWAESRQVELTRAFLARGDTTQIGAGRFQEIAGGKRVMYVEDYDADRNMRNVFIADVLPWESQGLPTAENVVVADGGAIRSDPQGNDYLELSQGHRYQGVVGQKDFTVTAFGEYRTLINARPSGTVSRKLKAFAPGELAEQPDSRNVRAEWQWRLALPLSVLLLTGLALPLARTNPRQGRYAGVLPAIGLYLGYMLMLMLGRNALDAGKLPSALGLWWAHAGLLVLVLVLIARGSGWGFFRKAVTP